MPVGYAVTVGLLGACTLAALLPVRRPPLAGVTRWVLGMVLNEQPFYAGYWLALTTWLVLAQGEITTTAAELVVVIAALTMAGLVWVAVRGWQARPVLRAALQEGLGPGWQGERARRRRTSYLRILLAPFVVRRRGVWRLADLRYGEAGRSNTLDVYRRRRVEQSAPVLVQLHGGGFRHGAKSRESRPLLYQFASHGWVCVSANYRLEPRATFPDYLVDVKKVIAWVRSQPEVLGCRPAEVVLVGSSAGAHLAATAALTANCPQFQPGFEAADTTVDAAVCLYGYFGPVRSSSAIPSTPMRYLGPQAPPVMVVHGDQDSFVLVEGPRRFVQRLRAASTNPVVYAELPGGQHAFDLLHSLRFDAVVGAVEDFADWCRGRR